MRSSHHSDRIGNPIVKTLIWDGHCHAVLNAVTDILARPGWRPALVIAAGAFVGVISADSGADNGTRNGSAASVAASVVGTSIQNPR